MSFDFSKITKEEMERVIIETADNMASAASDFNSHNYFQFLEARRALKELIHSVLTNVN